MTNWFITGTSSGFGRIMTEALLERGDTVFATLRRPEALAELADRYGDRLAVAALDVTDTQAVRAVTEEAFARFGRIDRLVSNAGVIVTGAAEELTDAQIEQQIATNLVGSIQLVRAALPHLRAQGGGHIIQLSSMGGHIAFPGFSVYHATKFAIEGFYESLIPEIAPFGINVTLVEPGCADTEILGANLVYAPVMPFYAETPAGDVRRLSEAGEFPMPGDARRMVAEMIAAGDAAEPPKRLTLGSDAYALIHAALSERLAALEAQKDLAHATDYPTAG